MNTRSMIRCVLAGLVSLTGSGCIVIGVGGWGWSCSGPTVWTEAATERFEIDISNLRVLDVQTHNGSIAFEGQPTGAAGAYVVVTKKAGGSNLEDAEAAFEAVDVFVEGTGADTQRIGWRWKGIKRSAWSARVNFDIKAPGALRFNGETHNGAVDISGVNGEVHVVTHNGPVNVDSSDGRLYAKTHNGEIVATYAGDDVTLISHNGRVSADLNRCRAINGSITTHNGGIEVVVGDATSVNLTCRTHNGRIQCDVPLNASRFSRRSLTGRIGTGNKGTLDLTTHNGSVRIRKTTG